MAYRRLIEVARAREQLDLDMLRRLRFLERRVRFPGHVRTVSIETLGTNVPTIQTIATLSVGAGAWHVTAACDVFYPAVADDEAITVSIDAHDQDTGSLLAHVDNRQTGNPNTGTATTASLSVVLVGYFASVVPAQLRMNVALSTSGASHAAVLNRIKMIAAPV